MGAGGGAAGIVAGVLFGDACAMLRPVGLAYVGPLEAAVYPYLITFLMPPNSPGDGALRELWLELRKATASARAR